MLIHPVGLISGGGAPPTFTLDGSAQDAVSSATFVYTVVGTIPVGRVAVVASAHACTNTQSGLLSSVADSKGNTWTVDRTDNPSTSGFPTTGLASAQVGTQLTTGDTITMTFANAGAGGGHGAVVGYLTGAAAASVADKKASANGASNSPTATTAALTQSNEIAIGVVAESSTGAITEDGSFTNVAQLTYATSRRVNVGYFTTTATTAVTYAPTLTGTPNWSLCLVTYKGA